MNEIAPSFESMSTGAGFLSYFWQSGKGAADGKHTESAALNVPAKGLPALKQLQPGLHAHADRLSAHAALGLFDESVDAIIFAKVPGLLAVQQQVLTGNIICV